MQGFKDLKTLQKYTDKYGRFQEGEVVQVHDEDKLYIYKDSQWTELKAEMVDSNIQMNLYDLNKQIMVQMDPVDWELYEEDINNWAKENSANYYMMLCKDISYYTVFAAGGQEDLRLGTAVKDCLTNVGEIVSVEINPEVIEIWIKEKDEAFCIHLFVYDEGVVNLNDYM